MTDIFIVTIIIVWMLAPAYLAGKMDGWESGRTVYRMWDSRRFTEILAKHLDIQTDDGCDVDYVRQAIKSAKNEYERR